jgi:hypothetical protein
MQRARTNHKCVLGYAHRRVADLRRYTLASVGCLRSIERHVAMRILLSIVLAVFGSQNVHAERNSVEVLIARMSKALMELPENRHELEQGLVAKGLAKQDADRQVQSLVEGVVRCLVEDLRAYSEAQGESITTKLPHILEVVDRGDVKALLKEMVIVSNARGTEGESCARNELQKAGISPGVVE